MLLGTKLAKTELIINSKLIQANFFQASNCQNAEKAFKLAV